MNDDCEKRLTPLRSPRGPWEGVADADWNDWRWQLKNRITDLDQLRQRLTLTPEEEAGAALAETKLSLSITPYFFALLDTHDFNCPLRRQVIPRIEEMHTAPGEMSDPQAEDSHSPVPGLVHRYPDRVLFLVIDRCAAYCRYCTRSRLVSNAQGYDFMPHYEEAIAYLRAHREVRDVLLSGGDPLLLGNEKIEMLLSQLRAIPHIEFLRIGTRIPIFLPQRITLELCAILKKFHPLWMSLHSNHVRELTPEVQEACARLADAGIPLGNQSVLLRGVNDDPQTMKALVHKLLTFRVRPYYIYACDLIAGTSHFRASIAKGVEIIEALRGHTSGYAVPQFVIDAPGGGGKIPINPGYVLYCEDRKIVMRNYEGKVFEYPSTQTVHPSTKPSRIDTFLPEQVGTQRFDGMMVCDRETKKRI